jgi:hypothetical protein
MTLCGVISFFLHFVLYAVQYFLFAAREYQSQREI